MSRHGRVGGLRFPVAFAALTVSCWIGLLTSADGWWWSWRMAVDNAVGSVTIFGPVLAGLAASTYAGLRQGALADLTVGSVRPVRGWFGPAVRLWAAAVLALLGVLIVITVRARFLDVPTPPRQFVIVPLGILVLAVHTMIGMVLGLRVSPRAAPVLAAFVSFGLFLLAVSHLAPPSFVTGGVTGAMFGAQYRIGSVVVLCLFAVGSALVLVPWSGWTSRPVRVRWVASGAAAAALIGLAQVSWPDVESRLETAQIRYRCGSADPEVCFPEDRMSDDFEQVSDQLRRLSQPLVDAGAVMPARWVMRVYPDSFDPAAGDLSYSNDLRGLPDDDDLVQTLMRPALCTQYAPGMEPQHVFDGRVGILYWVRFHNGFGGVKDRPWFHSADGRAWVKKTYGQLRRCDLDAVYRP